MSQPQQEGGSVLLHEPLARHTSLKVGGPADRFTLARSPDEAVAALREAEAQGWSVRVIGGGSNLLAADEGVEGLVMKYVGAQHSLRVHGERAVLVVEAGASLAGLARRIAKQGWAGLEWAVNVPGTVGGAAVNNAGAFGSSTQECLLAVELVTAWGDELRLARAELAYSYRGSRLKRQELGAVVVLRAAFELRKAEASELMQRVSHNQELRTKSQPRQLSAGSVFANPEGDYSGRLIEAAGLKGARRGGAQISPQHANFIVNLGGAHARDVYELMRTVQAGVWEKFGTWLRPEIELIGRWSGEDLARLERADLPCSHSGPEG